jgi:hypothetical protein
MNVRLETIVVCLSLVACGGAATPAPHLSAAQYDANAAREQREADTERQQFEPNAVVREEHCPSAHGGIDADAMDLACWTADYNPTEAHLAEAERHRKAAARFRALSQALRDAEATACAGLSDHDRDTSPFVHTDDIIDVEPLYLPTTSDAGRLERKGAVFTFRQLPGMTTQWLQKVMSCHIARNDAMGHVVPEMETCPLVPPNVKALVRPTTAGFAVEVSSTDSGSVAEILRRADLLQQRRMEQLDSSPAYGRNPDHATGTVASPQRTRTIP